ncbi:DUF4232 domain-containing protein [Streptomyces sp. NPDC048290]|uniref:DUF4232 domain-containing protein n=1 Tax=Streptomyces sp. NPDC048290 TaxID=3155811 RepID=UPI0034219A30
MRVHKLTLAAVAVVASLSLTACQGEDGAAGQSDKAAASSSSGGSGTGTGTSKQGGTQDTTTETGSDTGSGSTDTEGNAGVTNCTVEELEITASDTTIDGDGEGTVSVEMANISGSDCLLSGFAGVDLETDAGTLSAERTGDAGEPTVLGGGESAYFGVFYPLNDSGGSGVGVSKLVVTPPNETKVYQIEWPGGSLPVTDGSGSSVRVGAMGSVGQGG